MYAVFGRFIYPIFAIFDKKRAYGTFKWPKIISYSRFQKVTTMPNLHYSEGRIAAEIFFRPPPGHTPPRCPYFIYILYI